MAVYRYYTHYPQTYDMDVGNRWPLLIALHGRGESYVPLEELQTHHYWQPMYQLTTAQFPMVVVIPQCPPRQYWEPTRVKAVIDEVVHHERIDVDRIYMTGFSMGGYGTWMTAVAYPHLLAAIAPVCGGGDPEDVEILKEVPTWAFHGAKDNVVPPTESQIMIDALVKVGGKPKFTIYPEGDHGVWDETFANPELYAWFMQHSMAERRPQAA